MTSILQTLPPAWRQAGEVPPLLQAEGHRALEALRTAAGSGESSAIFAAKGEPAAAPQAVLARLLACSPFVASTLTRSPALLIDLPLGLGTSDPSPLVPEPPAFDPGLSEAAFMAALRAYRQRVMVQIVFAALGGEDSLADVLSATSRLADICLRIAVQRAQAQLSARHGQPRDGDGRVQHLITLAMGKLGGEELNFSSDIDLIFLFRERGSTDGARSISNEEYFARVTQRVVRYLDQRTADGFVFRVDTRLRPFGASGAPVHSLAALEDYLHQHARAWERYAYVRARPVTGGAQDRVAVLELLRPFVFRRYLDYSVLASVRDIRERIAAQSHRQDRTEDLKLGPGGIREIEFIVQTFQVLYGGRDRALRRPGVLAALVLLEERELLSEASTRKLREAYVLLRRVENAVQMTRDEQRHVLPDRDEERARLAYHLAFDDWPALSGALNAARSCVVLEFAAAVVGGGSGPEAAGDLSAVASGRVEGDEAAARLADAGLAGADEVAGLVASLREATWYRRLTQAARERLDALMPRLLAEAARARADVATVQQLLTVLEAIGGRSVYFVLLIENPHALTQLVKVCQLGPVVATHLVHTPALIDELLDPALLLAEPTEADLAEELARRLDGLDMSDEESWLDALRAFQRGAVFQIAVSDLSGVLSVSRVSDLLSAVAELLLERALSTARQQLARRYGVVRNAEGREMRFCVLGYGKLGGRELGYSSDLDLVFLHEDGTGQSDGEHPLEAQVYFIRLAQRIIHVLSTQTGAGVLYQVDTRLRPSGNSGLLVTSFGAFATYQKNEAWTWEHQALLRARTVAGDAPLRERAETLRSELLCRTRDVSALRSDVASMRERMRSARPASEAFDVKGDPGGLVDLEFLVQFLVLAHGHEHPGLVAVRENVSQLRALAAAGILASARAEALADAYYALRALAHRASLRGDERALVPVQEAEPARTVIQAAFSDWIGSAFA
ncbi:MAG: bifunctional [glutamate--ammonia ligase]-adenylyl-L-tyrosine phosphorylase/[glutamate--ammonia-ligase] adenylyltransferase [Pseudomonadota bacterium]